MYHKHVSMHYNKYLLSQIYWLTRQLQLPQARFFFSLAAVVVAVDAADVVADAVVDVVADAVVDVVADVAAV